MSRRPLWAIVLAGGQGTRLASLTRALYRRDLPKQFAVLEGDRSMLQRTLARIAPLVPPERTIVVVGPGHESIAREQLAAFPVDLLVQPADRGTAAAVLSGLAEILARDPRARVGVFPADHHIRNAAPILEVVDDGSARAWPTLIGVAPETPETEYGWIVPGRRLDRRRWEVARFVEKPHADLAARLVASGSLWNTFILAARGIDLWTHACVRLPLHGALLSGVLSTRSALGRENLRRLAYARMPSASFSEKVLQRAEGLAVAPVAGAGWSDWGSPRRVFSSLEGTPHYQALLERIAGAVA